MDIDTRCCIPGENQGWGLSSAVCSQGPRNNKQRWSKPRAKLLALCLLSSKRSSPTQAEHSGCCQPGVFFLKKCLNVNVEPLGLDLGTSSSSVTWELGRNADSQALQATLHECSRHSRCPSWHITVQERRIWGRRVMRSGSQTLKWVAV